MNFLKAIIPVFAAALAISACAKHEGYIIEGSINQKEGTIYLQNFRNKMFFVVDSAKIENGKFRFTGQVDKPELFGLTQFRDESFQPVFLFAENSRIEVRLDTANPRQAAIKGSDAHDLYEYYLSNRGNFNIDSFITANPASPVAAYILYRDYPTRLNAQELRALSRKFEVSLQDHPFIAEIQKVIETKEELAEGKEAADFSGTSPEGHTIRLSDFRGNYLLLEFWAAWCGPCRRENPGLVRVYDKFHGKGFDILGVSLDRSREDWIRAIDDDGLAWSHVSDLKFWDSEPAGLYGIRHIPSNVLISPEGLIVARNLKSDRLEEVLDGLISN